MRLVVAIVGGLAPALLDRWNAMLPFFAALRREGRLRPLASTPVPYEAPALATAFTGRGQGAHGVYSMWRMRAPRVDTPPAVIDSGDLGCPLLWESAEFGARQAILVNLIGSHPPRPLSGVAITYPWYPTTNAAWPRGLLAELHAATTPVPHDVSVFFRPDTDRAGFEQAVTRIETARLAGFRTLCTRPHDLAVLNITLIDRLSHFLWHEVEEEGRDPADMALWRAYRRVDAMLNELADSLGPDDRMLVFGDLGFGPLDRFVSIDALLAAAGVMVPGEGGCPDPRRTLAFEAPQGSHGVVLACADRFADGIVTPARRDAVLAEVTEILCAARVPETGVPLFRAVRRGADLYPGPHAADAPDLVVEPFDPRLPPRGHRHWADHVSRDCQSGWHRRDTVWGWVGPAPAGAVAEMADIHGVMAQMLGMAVPQRLAG